ncbi:transmembrane protein, putative, partial [Rhizoctonia solani AG-3 Rhs1AP]
MSNPSNPELSPTGGLPIPDFLNAELVGDGIVPPPAAIPDELDFSIKQSSVSGLDSGTRFDEGAYWYPLREVHFALSDDTVLDHYQGHYYHGEYTSTLDESPPSDPEKLQLQDGEYIVGYRSYLENDVLVGVRIWTNRQHKDIGKVHGPTRLGEDPEAFFVPENHEVINFFGYTNDKNQINGLGVSYTRRPDSGAGEIDEAPGGLPNPKLTTFLSENFLDASTQQAWSNNDMAAIVAKRDKASQQLAPLLEKIEKEGKDAWTGIPDKEQSEIKKIALAFVYMLKPLISEGIQWGLKFAESQLKLYLGKAAAAGLALLVPASLASTGGLLIGGIVASLIVAGALKLFKKIIKKYFLVLNSHGQWQNKTVPKFKPIDKSVLPPNFSPDRPFINVATCLAMTFDNKSVWKGGVGEGVLMSRGDKGCGLALGYLVHAWKDNELGLEPINGNPTSFDVKKWYNKKGSIVKRLAQEVSLGALTIAGSTPTLGGESNGGYFFDVSIELPPHVTI